MRDPFKRLGLICENYRRALINARRLAALRQGSSCICSGPQDGPPQGRIGSGVRFLVPAEMAEDLGDIPPATASPCGALVRREKGFN